MEVFKFGGASVRDAENIKNVGTIIQRKRNGKLLVVVSAMGKMTNALEKVITAFYNENLDDAEKALDEVKQYHSKEIIQLFDSEQQVLSDVLSVFETGMNHLRQSSKEDYDKDYDQIVTCG